MSVSIYDIAKVCGVSAATVSNVLNDRGRFSQRTKRSVLKAANDLGYAPNLTARSLRVASTKTVAIITPDVCNDFFSNIVLHIERGMYLKGYASYIANSSYRSSVVNEYLQNLYQRGIDGYFLVGYTGEEDFSIIADKPCALLDYTGPSRPDQYFLAVNDIGAMIRDQVRVLADRGCTRIALSVINTDDSFSQGGSLYNVFRDALQKNGLHFNPQLLLSGPHLKSSRRDSYERVSKALSSGLAIDGIAAIGDRLALGALEAVRDHGLKVGHDVKVMGIDDSLYSQISHPAISTISRNTNQLAMSCVEAMSDMLEGIELPCHEIVIPHKVIERESTLER
ncbi:LacI family DNA-binding transcriptional regulator [Olsenella massiliensis]|uniref:LacI family DNA-binding transcriptional regulator n=1 Tax=Olsenella massiliensis TaxID=1622075 RepID=UPI00071DA2C9|nr:LacI family DNA-binding transcriptional regulator [Olsenella massiliensis]